MLKPWIVQNSDNNELEQLLMTYFAVFPDGKDRREKWKNIAYFYIEPKWIRYSDFNEMTSEISEINF